MLWPHQNSMSNSLNREFSGSKKEESSNSEQNETLLVNIKLVDFPLLFQFW